MPDDNRKEIELEIAHVLFIDVVGYSKLSANEQHARINELNEVVRSSEQFRKAETANRLLKIPTGDGMALEKQLLNGLTSDERAVLGRLLAKLGVQVAQGADPHA